MLIPRIADLIRLNFFLNSFAFNSFQFLLLGLDFIIAFLKAVFFDVTVSFHQTNNQINEYPANDNQDQGNHQVANNGSFFLVFRGYRGQMQAKKGDEDEEVGCLYYEVQNVLQFPFVWLLEDNYQA